MGLKRIFTTLSIAFAFAAITLSLAVSSQAQTESVLYKFPGGTSGENPSGPLIFDSAGNLYGTTPSGGGGGEPYFAYRIHPRHPNGPKRFFAALVVGHSAKRFLPA